MKIVLPIKIMVPINLKTGRSPGDDAVLSELPPDQTIDEPLIVEASCEEEVLVDIGAVDQHTTNWMATTYLLLDRIDQPACILDRRGVIRAMNSNMGQLLGWSREQLTGRSWNEAVDDHKTEPPGPWPPDAAFQGTVETAERAIRTKSGRSLTLILGLSAVGEGESAALIAIVNETKASPDATIPVFFGDIHYEVSAEPGHFGILLSVVNASDKEAEIQLDEPCYRGLYQRETPCIGCPLFLSSTPDRFQAAVITSDGDPDSIRMVSAQPNQARSLSVRARAISEDLLSLLINARVHTLGQRAGLSDRERLVLDHLVRGRTADEIAQLLGITARTVKFHQANLLQKLQLSSRLDLLRLLL